MDAKCKRLLVDFCYAASYGGFQTEGPGVDPTGEIPLTFLDSFRASKQWVKGASQEEQLKALAKFLVSYYGLADSIVIEDRRTEYTLPVIPVRVDNCFFLEVEERLRRALSGEVGEALSRRCSIRDTFMALLEETGTQKTSFLPRSQKGNQCRCSIVLLPVLKKEAELLGKLDKIQKVKSGKRSIAK